MKGSLLRMVSLRWVNKYIIYTSLALICAIYVFLLAFIFFIPHKIDFSYSNKSSCSNWPVVLPSLNRPRVSDRFNVKYKDIVKVGGLQLYAKQVCTTPSAMPLVGNNFIAISPFNNWFLQQKLVVVVGEPPQVDMSQFARPLVTTKPLIINLTSPDIINDYQVEIGGKSTSCSPVKGSPSVACDVQNLGLGQGEEYKLNLVRYKHQLKHRIASANVQTLTSVTISGGSVGPDETLYLHPSELTFSADKALQSAKVDLKSGDSAVNLETTVKDKNIIIKLQQPLAGDKQYSLTITDVLAVDGSALSEPYVINFKTAGGPKVVGVSVGSYGVAQNASVTVSFDQNIDEKQNITDIATVSGVNARVTRSSKTITYTLQSAPRCADFVLKIAPGLMNDYGMAAKSTWQYSSRTICQVASVYGYSVQNRPLVAYYFGDSGPATMYVAAIHGNESSSRGLMLAWVDYLEANPLVYKNRRVVVVPSISPDGIAARSRVNKNGVNLNRNFPTANWVKDINDTDGQHAGGGGSAPLSEPEAQALANLTTSVRPRLLFSFHAIGSLVEGDVGAISADYAARYGALSGYRNVTGNTGTFNYDLTGTYESWLYTKLAIPSVLIELGSYTGYSFNGHRSALLSTLD